MDEKKNERISYPRTECALKEIRRVEEVCTARKVPDPEALTTKMIDDLKRLVKTARR